VHSHACCSQLFCVYAYRASDQPRAGWGLSWGQHGRRTECPVWPQHWHFQYGCWLLLTQKHTDSQFNTAIGAGTLLFNTANFNTATGAAALLSNTAGVDNTAIGAFALFANTVHGDNTAVGAEALQNNSDGAFNTAVGAGALFNNTTGTGNATIGFDGLFQNSTGNQNTAIGSDTLENSTGSNNTAVGFFSGSAVTTANNVICIGAVGQNVDNSCYIGNISGADATGGDAVFITTDGKLGTVNPPSSARYKENIKPMDQASQAILALKPVTFRYKKEFDSRRVPQFGLVAEEVEKVNPDLVKRDRDGKLQTVRYDAVNAMLLNEFLKEHKAFVQEQRKMEELEATVSGQQKQLEVLVAGLEKATNQLKASKGGPTIVANQR
jgi:Chaperone of endosialidase